MSMIQPDDGWHEVALGVFVFALLVVLLIWASGCCQTCPTYDRPVMVDASAIWKCGDHWCVSDGWMAVHNQDEASMQAALRQCLDALDSCPE